MVSLLYIKVLRQFVRSRHTISRLMSSVASYNYETLEVTSPSQFVYQVALNRPEKKNAMNRKMWLEISECFKQMDDDAECRAVVLASKGNVFCAGLDLMEASQHLLPPSDDIGRKAFYLRKFIQEFQNSMTSLEKCLKPVIAAIQGPCVGGAMDLITAADIRYATKSAWFQVKEVDIGLAADVGTLQRLPKITGNDSLTRELAYTARKLDIEEAEKVGLVNRVFPDHASLLSASIETATLIASKSPIAVQGSKRSLVYSRDHSVQEGLDDVATWNLAMLQSEDLMKAVTAAVTKEKAEFAKL